MGLLDLFFGNKKNIIKDFKSKDAIIIDVRTPSEYKQGAITGSRNIPLQIIESKIGDIKQFNKPVITCCASGMRSASAALILKKHGIVSVNGGSWTALKTRL